MSASFKNAVDNAHAFTTGSGNTTVSGAGANDVITLTSNILEAGSLTISGAAAVTATAILENVDASGSTGALTLTFDDATDNAISLTAGTGNLNLTGGAAGDTITVTGAATAGQVITGAVSQFNITAGDNAQSITGGVANDTISAGAGNDTIVASAGNDVVTAGDGDDVFQFTAALFEGNSATTATFAGGNDANTLVVTQASVGSTDADFRGMTGIQTLTLTGVSTVVLGANANTAGIATVNVGDGNTSITSTVVSALTVNAAAFAGENDTLTLASTAAVTVTGLNGDITAAGSTGTLNVSLSNAVDNAHSVTTGSGATTITGAGANDTITVSGNASSITASGSSVYSITGGAAGQTIIGSGQNDTITPGGGFDNVSAGNGVDNIISTYADFTDDATGADTIDGGAGSDVFTLTSVSSNVGPVSLVNLSNTETLSVSTGAGAVVTTVTLDQATVARNVDGNNNFTLLVTDQVGGDNDTIVVSAAAVTSNLGVTVTQADGGIGSVRITTGSGADTITGSENDDIIATGLGNDSISADDGDDTITAGGGNDTLLGEAGDDDLDGGDGDDVLTGGADDDDLTGGLGIDTFNISAGNDTIADLGVGADLLIVTGGTVTASITTGTWAPVAGGAANGGAVILNLANAATGVDLTNASGNNGFTINAGTGGDAITGSANADAINGNTGADTIYGGGGADVILGGDGADVIYGDAGNDAIEGGLDADTLTGGAGIDTFTLTSILTTDSITDFSFADGDVLQIDQSDFLLPAGAAGRTVYTGGAGGIAFDGSEEIVVLNAVSYATDAAAAEAVAASVTVGGFDMVIVYHNSTTGKVHVIHTTDSDTGANVRLVATLDNVTTLAALATAGAGNFGGRA